ncbi:MAG: hypothetical protein WA956_05740 [Stenotrophomonas sp.]
MRNGTDTLQGTHDVQLSLPVCAYCGTLVAQGKLVCAPCDSAPMPLGIAGRILGSLDRRFHEELGGVE